MIGHRVPAFPCPDCGEILSGATAADGEDLLPQPGDVSVCLYCATLLRFDGTLALRKLTADVMDEFDNDIVIALRDAQLTVLAMIAKKVCNG